MRRRNGSEPKLFLPFPITSVSVQSSPRSLQKERTSFPTLVPGSKRPKQRLLLSPNVRRTLSKGNNKNIYCSYGRSPNYNASSPAVTSRSGSRSGKAEPKTSPRPCKPTVSHWKLSTQLEDILSRKLSPNERKYLASSIMTKDGAHRCSKNHVICTHDQITTGSFAGEEGTVSDPRAGTERRQTCRRADRPRSAPV